MLMTYSGTASTHIPERKDWTLPCTHSFLRLPIPWQPEVVGQYRAPIFLEHVC